ncbi:MULTISPECIES: rod shape-determining protein MreD [Candidatus Ichthyocystis]|uniref:Putative rod shape-determining protein MreD n=1 Tax=Candidatus Ichthyocystis hellenicum TaxID=1561003 RepID=A0A0S4M0B5_9BURK|nr:MULTISPECIES: rod shape-determining protein MreD [Ichthyocystis]CUT17253.1 putative rod shape-determining protein MreD [Candidatus Ichthyocystis hellenicum]
MPLLRGKHTILLPVNPLFVQSTIIASFLINLSIGKAAEFINILDTVFFFWCLRENRIIKSGTGFLIGILTDLYFNTTIGQNALCYTVTTAIANKISVRFLSLPLRAQALLILLVLSIKNTLTAIMFIIFAGKYQQIGIVVSPIVSAAMYPVFASILLSPQLKPTSSNETPI